MVIHTEEKDHLSAETLAIQASSLRQRVEKGRGMGIMVFTDAFAVTGRNTSTANT